MNQIGERGVCAGTACPPLRILGISGEMQQKIVSHSRATICVQEAGESGGYLKQHSMKTKELN